MRRLSSPWLAERRTQLNRVLRSAERRRYGVGDSVAEGDSVGDVSASFFAAAFFFLGVGVGVASSAAAPFFFAVVFFVVAAVPVEVVAAVSCFCAQEMTNAVAITATSKDNNDFFISVWLRFAASEL